MEEEITRRLTPVKIPPVNPDWKLDTKARNAYEMLRTVGDIQAVILQGQFPGAAAHRATAMLEWIEPHVVKAEKEWGAVAPKQPTEPTVEMERA